MVSGIDVPRLSSRDVSQQGIGFDEDPVCRETVIRRYGIVPFRRAQVLDKSSAVLDIKDLKPPADSQQRQIALQSFSDQGTLNGIALVIRLLGSRLPDFTVSGRVDIVSARQQ